MHLRRNLACALAASAALGAAPVAHADTVTLHNGDRLTGKVMHKSGDVLTLQTDYAGLLTIRWSAVAAISTDKPVTVMLEGSDQTERGALPDVSGGVPLAKIAFINPLPEESGRGASYKGRVTLAASSTSGNTSTERLYAEGAFRARAKSHRYELHANAQNASDSGTATAANWRATGQFDHFLDGNGFAYGRTSFEHDRFKDIALRSTVGAGYGVEFIDTDTTQLSLRGGLDVVWLNRYEGMNENFPALGWGLQFSHWLWTHTLEAFLHQDGYANLKNSGQVSLYTRTGLRMPLKGGVTANLQANVDWESDPAPGRKATDTTWLLGMGYEW